MRAELRDDGFTDMRGDVFYGECKMCGHLLHFLDGDDDKCWMVCDTCLSITCDADSQEETLTQWRNRT